MLSQKVSGIRRVFLKSHSQACLHFYLSVATLGCKLQSMRTKRRPTKFVLTTKIRWVIKKWIGDGKLSENLSPPPPSQTLVLPEF